MQNQGWHLPPRPLLLRENEVHVWRASLDRATDDVAHWQTLLRDDEVERAGRFYFEKDRRHWIVARATLRALLGRYLEIEPQELRFAHNEYGKPSIASPTMGQHLQFNLSHSGELALYAFAYNRAVGVDVEQMRAPLAYEELATHFFSAHECHALLTLPEEQREEAFFLCWSRKEAYIKARGKGLSLPLNQFDVSLAPGEPARLLDSREEPQVAERWSLAALLPGTGYAGALVAEGSGWQLHCWQWQG